MRDYETTFIVDAHLPDDQLNATIEKFTKLLETEGNRVLLVDRWGKRRLAYEIAKKQYGYYVYVRFQSDPAFIAELERIYKLDDAILRYLTVIVPPVVLKEEARKKLRKEKQAKADKEAGGEEVEAKKKDSVDDRADSEEPSDRTPPSESHEEEEEPVSASDEEEHTGDRAEESGEADPSSGIRSGMEHDTDATGDDKETDQAEHKVEEASEEKKQEQDGEQT